MKTRAIGGSGLLEEMGLLRRGSLVDVAETTTRSEFVRGSLRVTNVAVLRQRCGTNRGDVGAAGEVVDLEDGAVLAVALSILLNTTITGCFEDGDAAKTKLKGLVTLTL